jgi:FRG domain
MPAYLFRGEVGWFDQCVSRKERVRQAQFRGVTIKELEPIERELDSELRSRLGLNQMLSAGLMQHYGFPTELMDASASIEAAAFFSRLGAGQIAVGAFAVFDMAVLTRNAIVIDLTGHPTAVRPRRQQAYGVFDHRHSDLKGPEAVADMGITWYTFLADPCETVRLTDGGQLLSVEADETAGLLRLFLDGSIKNCGKVSQEVADYLAYRIAHCPLVGKVNAWYRPGQPKEFTLVTPEAASMPINEQNEIQTSVQVWSRRYPSVCERPMKFVNAEAT